MVADSTVNSLLSMAGAWHRAKLSKTLTDHLCLQRPLPPSYLCHFQEEVLEENLRSNYVVILQVIPLFNDVQHVFISICLMIHCSTHLFIRIAVGDGNTKQSPVVAYLCCLNPTLVPFWQNSRLVCIKNMITCNNLSVLLKVRFSSNLENQDGIEMFRCSKNPDFMVQRKYIRKYRTQAPSLNAQSANSFHAI